MRIRIRRVEGPTGLVLVTDSVTDLHDVPPGSVAVTGSHGGETAVRYAGSTGLGGVIVNDAGVGCDDAGIAGLAMAEAWGLAVAAVAHTSARIGDGEDTWATGRVTQVNSVAAACGVEPGMPAAAAARLLLGVPPRSGGVAPPRPGLRIVLRDGDPPVIGLDSAASVSPADAGSIVVTGSHGGLVGGAPLRHPVLAAFFNDAGIGKDAAGIARLGRLDAPGIPGVAVSHDSARIGDAAHTYRHGRVSHVNREARAAGVRVGLPVQDATALLAERLGPRLITQGER